jgi:hypothetical protein
MARRLCGAWLRWRRRLLAVRMQRGQCFVRCFFVALFVSARLTHTAIAGVFGPATRAFVLHAWRALCA